MPGGSATKRVPSTALTANDSTAQEALGAIRFDTDGRTYRYYQTISTVAIGDLVNHTLSTGIASARVAPTLLLTKIPAGVAVGTVTASYFGWFQVGGPVGPLNGGTTRVRTATKVVGGAFISQSVSRKASIVSAGNEHLVFGIARATDSGSFCIGAYLTNIAGGV